MRRTHYPDATGIRTEEPGAVTGESGAYSSGRVRRRRRRGYVLPLDDSQLQGPYGVRHSRRRRRRRGAGVGGIEIFIGLSALWTVLVVGTIMLEALSGQEWFFVARPKVSVADHGAWLLGDQVLQADGELAIVSPATEQTVSALVSGAPEGEVEMLWGRVLAALASVPLSYIVYRAARRFWRMRQGRTR